MSVSFFEFLGLLALLAPCLVKAADLPEANSKKVTVCTAPISSQQEMDVFKKNLNSGKNAGQFNFVDLTTLGTPPGQTEGVVPDWFDRACQSGVQCDMLVVSAHFSSTGFFSDRTNPNPLRYPLRTEKIEKHSCAKDCTGVLNHPREVFLLSCNTLSSKDTDHRTPQKYLQILKTDGAVRWKAERAVEDRYGTLGPQNRQQIEFAFEGVPMLTGFRSTSQLADDNSRYLESYFKKIPDYAQHLQIDAVEQINRSIATVHDFNANKAIMSSFIGTSVCVSSGLNASHDPAQAAFWANICSLRNESSPLEDRMKLVGKMLADPKIAAYIPDIENFLEGHTPPEIDLSPQEQAQLSALKDQPNMAAAKKFVFDQIKEKQIYPTLQRHLVVLAQKLQWMDSGQANQMLDDIKKRLADDKSWPDEGAF